MDATKKSMFESMSVLWLKIAGPATVGSKFFYGSQIFQWKN